MATAIQRRRGNTAQHASFTGLAGEITIDTQKNTVVVHDGTTAYITIYGSVCSNVSADIVELSSNINGVSGNVSVYATSNSANALVNVVASYIKT